MGEVVPVPTVVAGPFDFSAGFELHEDGVVLPVAVEELASDFGPAGEVTRVVGIARGVGDHGTGGVLIAPADSDHLSAFVEGEGVSEVHAGDGLSQPDLGGMREGTGLSDATEEFAHGGLGGEAEGTDREVPV